MAIDLSYIISTRNRLPFLKITLEKLLNIVQDDEEIVIVDGNSTDGSNEYLHELYNEGKIHQFISEPDKNQSHGWNKAMLMAQGTLIKKIIDDDVFCYSTIRKCKEYMLAHPEIDVLISNDLSCSLLSPSIVSDHSRYSQFQNWKAEKKPSFTFGDVHMLIRKSSLSYIGLYRTDFVMMDWEYSLRISYLKAKIGYYTGYNALSVAHPESVSALKSNELIQKQGDIFCRIYEYKGDKADISPWSRMKILGGRILKRQKEVKPGNNLPCDLELNKKYQSMYEYIEALNKDSEKYSFY